MAKTKPIGIRFDEDTLKKILEIDGISTPQGVHSYLELFYNNANALIKDANAMRTHGQSVTVIVKKGEHYTDAPKKESIPQPIGGEMPKGLSLDQRIEWMEKNQKGW